LVPATYSFIITESISVPEKLEKTMPPLSQQPSQRPHEFSIKARAPEIINIKRALKVLREMGDNKRMGAF
jgi:hypothetical protein